MAKTKYIFKMHAVYIDSLINNSTFKTREVQSRAKHYHAPEMEQDLSVLFDQFSLPTKRTIPFITSIATQKHSVLQGY